MKAITTKVLPRCSGLSSRNIIGLRCLRLEMLQIMEHVVHDELGTGNVLLFEKKWHDQCPCVR